MIRISALVIAVGSFCVANCLPSFVMGNDMGDNSTASSNWDDNLPPSPFSNEQIEQWIAEIKQVNVALGVKEDAIDGLNRMKRNTAQGDSSHWCCNKRDPGQQGERREVIKARVVQKTIPQGGSIRCGLFGLSRCGSSRTVVVTVTEYFTDYEYPTIPAPEWTNGCPEANIVCCNGYAYYANLGNCLTFAQLEAILKVVRENQEALYLLNMFLGGSSAN